MRKPPIKLQERAVEVAAGQDLEQARALHDFYNKCKSLQRSRS